MKTKVCLCCKKELPVSEFWISRAKKDGLQIYCKKCKNAKDLIARKKRQAKKRLEREKLRIYKSVKESKTKIHWSYPFGGYKITIQNYVKNGEFKYNVLPIGGKLFATNSKQEFMDYLEAI